jgi:arylsulfatase A-like enzyme
MTRIIISLLTFMCCAAAVARAGQPTGQAARQAPRPNVVFILADDLGFSDLGCYGSEIETPNLDRLAAGGLRFTQFYNAARCCPSRAALLTGLYPHQAGVGYMNQDWSRFGSAYAGGLNAQSATVAELLGAAGYRNYLVGKWHVANTRDPQGPNFPLNRGFDRFYGTFGGGHFFRPDNLFDGRAAIKPEGDYYFTDAVTEHAVRFLDEHGREHAGKPFFLHVCYTAPHFPLHARPREIAKYRGKYRDGWDALRARRYARQKRLGIVDARWQLSPRDPVARPWAEAEGKDEWDLRMAVHAAMVDRMDQGVGRVLDAVKRMGAERNTLVLFLSDNGASAEFMDTWPNPARGHKPGAATGTDESYRMIEIGWANAANTPWRENKMWAHEGGISTPLVAHWPDGIKARGGLTREVGHVVDFMPTLLELAGVEYPQTFKGRALTPPAGRSLAPVFQGRRLGARTVAWEHEGNRAVRVGDWKLVASFRGEWELYDLSADRTETHDLAARRPEKVRELAALWQSWADRVGVVAWEQLPGAGYKPSATYRRKSEPVSP